MNHLERKGGAENANILGVIVGVVLGVEQDKDTGVMEMLSLTR